MALVIHLGNMATTKSIDDELRKLLDAPSVPDVSAKLTDLKVTSFFVANGFYASIC